jgi:hypothetical protein
MAGAGVWDSVPVFPAQAFAIDRSAPNDELLVMNLRQPSGPPLAMESTGRDMITAVARGSDKEHKLHVASDHVLLWVKDGWAVLGGGAGCARGRPQRVYHRNHG